MLVKTGLNDSQVKVLGSPAKYVAKLRALKTMITIRCFLKTNMGAGHGGGVGPLRLFAWRSRWTTHFF